MSDIITVTPAGRKRYLEILVAYLLQNRQYIREHHFWVNTPHQADIDYIESLARQHPDFFKVNRRPLHYSHRLCDSIWQYFQDYVEDDTIYIRLDDDICYIAPDAIPTLASFRRAHPEPFLVYGNIVNNAICSYYQQAQGVLPRAWGTVGNICEDPVGWQSKRFAQRLHQLFLHDLAAGKTGRWKYPAQSLDDYRRFSINVICWYGQDMRAVPERFIPNLYVAPLAHPVHGGIIYDEESMLSEYLPARMERPNVICGDALFAHFAFYTQRNYLETVTPLLDEYRELLVPQNARAPKWQRQLERTVKPLNVLRSRHTWDFVRHRLSHPAAGRAAGMEQGQ